LSVAHITYITMEILTAGGGVDGAKRNMEMRKRGESREDKTSICTSLHKQPELREFGIMLAS